MKDLIFLIISVGLFVLSLIGICDFLDNTNNMGKCRALCNDAAVVSCTLYKENKPLTQEDLYVATCLNKDGFVVLTNKGGK